MSERIEVQVLAAAVEHDGHVDGAAAREDRADPLLLATAPDASRRSSIRANRLSPESSPLLRSLTTHMPSRSDHDGAREAVEQREVEAVAHAQGAEPADGGHDRVVAAAQRLDVVHQHDLVVVQHDPTPLRIVVRGQLAAVPVAGTHLAVCGDELAGGGPHGEKGVVVVACLGLQVVHRLLPAFGSGHLQPARHRLELAELVLHARIEVEDQLLAQLAQIHFAHVRDDVVGGLARGDDGVGQQQRHGHGHRHHSHRRAPAPVRPEMHAHAESLTHLHRRNPGHSTIAPTVALPRRPTAWQRLPDGRPGGATGTRPPPARIRSETPRDGWRAGGLSGRIGAFENRGAKRARDEGRAGRGAAHPERARAGQRGRAHPLLQRGRDHRQGGGRLPRGRCRRPSVYVYDNNSSDGTGAIAREHGAAVRCGAAAGQGQRRAPDAARRGRGLLRHGGRRRHLPGRGRAGAARPARGRRGRHERWATACPTARTARRTTAPSTASGTTSCAWLIKRIYGFEFKDVMTGYRAFNAVFAKTMPVLSPGFEIETELSIHAVDKRWRIAEVPIDYRDRPAGSVSRASSTRSPTDTKVLLTILSLFKDYRPLVLFSWLALLFCVLGLVRGRARGGGVHGRRDWSRSCRAPFWPWRSCSWACSELRLRAHPGHGGQRHAQGVRAAGDRGVPRARAPLGGRRARAFRESPVGADERCARLGPTRCLAHVPPLFAYCIIPDRAFNFQS